MASRFIRIEIVHASDDSSITKLSAYVARDQRYGVTGLRYDFTDRRDELVAHGLIIPKNAPDWAAVPEKLWREAERKERTWDRKAKCERWKKDAQIAKHIVVALPRELTDADHRELLLEFISKEFRPREHCVVIEWAIHKDNNNPHAHILISMRALGPDGFGNKVRAMNPKAWRAGMPRNDADWDEAWADFQREYIRKRYGVVAAETVRERAYVRRPRFARADPGREEKTRKFAEADRIIRNAQRLNPLVALRELTRHRAIFNVEDLRRYCASLKLPDDERLAFIHSVLGHAQCLELFNKRGELVGWTTAEVRSMEEAVLRRAIRWTQSRTFSSSWERATGRIVSRHFGLSEEQSRALSELVGSRLSLLRGRAGTGKSTTLNALRETLERCGWRVMALAPTNTVVSDLRKSGFKNARTIHSALWKLGRGTLKWDARSVIIVDEAAMIDTKLMDRLFAAVERTGARLVLAGDDRQFASVDAGGTFAEFVRCCGGPELKTVYRQQKKWQAEASEDLAAGDIARALESYYAAGRIVFVDSLEEARARAAADAAGFVYAATNAEVEALNLAIQGRRRAGHVPADAVDVQTVRGNFSIAPGERMQFYETDHEIGCAAAEFGTVVSVGQRIIRIEKDDGSVVDFDPRRFHGGGSGTPERRTKGRVRRRTVSVPFTTTRWPGIRGRPT